MKEQALLFGKAKSLVGIMTKPPSSFGGDGLPAIILLNAGMLHRVGPNRLYVKMARRIAASGYTVLRFDLSGIGDSRIRGDNLPFEKSSVIETREAMDHLSMKGNIDRFILVGICSGADLAYHTACADSRVAGAVMINGYYLQQDQVGDLTDRIKKSTEKRYLRMHVKNLGSWRRLITGKSNYGKIKEFLLSIVKTPDRRGKRKLPGEKATGIFDTLIERGTDMLLVYSYGSQALDMFRLTIEKELKVLRSMKGPRVEILNDVDHVFTLLWSQELLVDMIHQWLQSEERMWHSKQSSS